MIRSEDNAPPARAGALGVRTGFLRSVAAVVTVAAAAVLHVGIAAAQPPQWTAPQTIDGASYATIAPPSFPPDAQAWRQAMPRPAYGRVSEDSNCR